MHPYLQHHPSHLMILSSKSSLNLDVSQTTLGQVEDFPKGAQDFSPNPITAVVNETSDHHLMMKRRKPHSTSSGDFQGMTMPSMNEQASFE